MATASALDNTLAFPAQADCENQSMASATSSNSPNDCDDLIAWLENATKFRDNVQKLLRDTINDTKMQWENYVRQVPTFTVPVTPEAFKLTNGRFRGQINRLTRNSEYLATSIRDGVELGERVISLYARTGENKTQNAPAVGDAQLNELLRARSLERQLDRAIIRFNTFSGDLSEFSDTLRNTKVLLYPGSRIPPTYLEFDPFSSSRAGSIVNPALLQAAIESVIKNSPAIRLNERPVLNLPRIRAAPFELERRRRSVDREVEPQTERAPDVREVNMEREDLGIDVALYTRVATYLLAPLQNGDIRQQLVENFVDTLSNTSATRAEPLILAGKIAPREPSSALNRYFTWSTGGRAYEIPAPNEDAVNVTLFERYLRRLLSEVGGAPFDTILQRAEAEESG